MTCQGIYSEKYFDIYSDTGNTLILSLLLGSEGDHCDLELAVEVRRRRRRRPADIKSNNPHLTGGENMSPLEMPD